MYALGPVRLSTLALLALASVTACSSSEPSNEHAAQAVCAPTAPTECPEPAPHYPDVAPIFERRCASCHTGVKDAPWPLDNYDHVADWALVIRDELLQCLMPPSDSGVAMTPEERQAVLVWVRCGHPE
jgi:uncharacterized membrane protein